jgi:hypothetical protein
VSRRIRLDDPQTQAGIRLVLAALVFGVAGVLTLLGWTLATVGEALIALGSDWGPIAAGHLGLAPAEGEEPSELPPAGE